MLNQVVVAIDLEMTSPLPDRQEIIELAAVKFKGNRVLDSFSSLVNPRQSIPYNIQVLTGIRQEVVDHAPSLPEVVGQFVSFVRDLPLVAHNISSDIGCLQRKGVHLSNPQIDTFELASILLPQLPNYGLAALAAHLNIPVTSQHRAAGDALMTGKVFQALLRRAAELDLSIIQEINRLTANTAWPLRGLFVNLERERSRTTFTGSSIRDQLAAKGGLEEATFDFMYLGRPSRQPLMPNTSREPLDLEMMTAAFEPQGLLAEQLAGYEHRIEQTTMARAVASALNDGAHLVVEAGTGTGKSFAYLLPAAFFATVNSERVVISTNTINLQDQLFAKDIPDVQAASKLHLKVALVKGRANYLCPRRFASMRRQRDLTVDEVLTLIKVLVWLPMTRTGDVAELNLVEGQRSVWSKLNASMENCPGSHCPFYKKGSCFIYRARDAAESAHIVVVNHSLLLSDLFVSDKVLPDYRFLVVDEAHHFEDEATEQLGYRVALRDLIEYCDGLSQPITPERRAGLLAELRTHLRGSSVPASLERDIDGLVKSLHDVVDATRASFHHLGGILTGFLGNQDKHHRGYDARLRLTDSIRSTTGWSDVEIAWEDCAILLGRLIDGVQRIIAVLDQFAEANVLEYDELMANLSAQAMRANELRDRCGAVISRRDPTQVAWIALGQGQDLSIRAAPLHVGSTLGNSLFATKESIILTSATLSTAGSFQFFRERLGLPECREAQVDSPFDYQNAALIYIPIDIPEPEQPLYQRQVEQSILELCIATEGRALVLFTSYSQLNQTVRACRTRLEDRRILVLAQEAGGRGPSRRKLLESFKQNRRAVLFGAASFWEGIDVVGDALSLLVIARLPFAVPTDPVVAARAEQYSDSFHQYSIPRAILRLKQGFGRLIRSKTDRGAVVVLDRRIKTKSYGATFLRSLPPCTVKFGLNADAPAAVAEWLGQATDSHELVPTGETGN